MYCTNSPFEPQVTNAEYQQLITQGFQPQNPYLQQASHQTAAQTQAFQQHALPAVLPSQVTAPEPAYNLDQQAVQAQMTRHMSHVVSTYINAYLACFGGSVD